MNKKRLRTIALSCAGAFLIYVATGFLALPALLKLQLSAHVEQKLKHKLTLGEVRFNPLTFAVELNDLDLREASGGGLVSFKRLFINFQASSVFQHAWNFAEVTLESPVINAELRKDGSHNFTALLEALRDPDPDPPLPPVKVDRIKLTDGRIDLADLPAGEQARLRLTPIALELTGLSTLPGEKGPYKLSARTADGEALSWDGDISLNPIASSAKLALSGWKLATFTRLLGGRIAIEKAEGKLDATMDYTVSFTDGKPGASVKDFDLRLSQLAIVPKGGAGALIAADTLALSDLNFSLNERSIAAKRLEFARGKLALDIGADGQPNWAALIPAQVAESAPAQDSAARDSVTQLVSPGVGEQPSASPSWRIKLDELAVTDLAMKFTDRRAGAAAEGSFESAALGLALAAEVGNEGASVAVNGLKAAVNGLSLTQGAERMTAGQLEFSTGAIKVNLKSSATEMGLDTLTAALSALTASRAADEFKIQQLSINGQSVNVALAAEAKGQHRIGIDGAAIESSGIIARLGAAKTDAFELRGLGAGAKSIALVLGGEAIDASADGLRASGTGVSVREPTSGDELARIERAEVSGGTLNLRERRAQIERITLTNGHVAAVVDQSGKLNRRTLFDVLAEQTPVTPKSVTKPDPGPAWKAIAKNIELHNFGSTYTDHRQTPPTALALHDINISASNVSTDRATPAQLDLTGRIKDGGSFAAKGRVNFQTLETDLRLKLADLSLTPAQPFLAQHARLQITSAQASADGRLRYRQRKDAGADVLFEGLFGLSKVAIEETEPSQPFLALDDLKASEVRFAIGPNRLEIPDLRVSGMATRLLIAEDQSVNIVKLMRPRKEAAKPAQAPPATAQPAAGAEDAFPISIARIRVDDSRLEFSDLSLRPAFATRMDELKGVITGVSTARDSRAQAELEARVDEFGSARIRGEMNLFKPRAYTDIDMVFRNLEMTSLTPYSAKFAGYRIASGKLSMDVRYRIKDGMLVGENKIVLDKLELGERVENPSAFNLPLELAIAILKDSDGRIDIGVPVSGSLDDPQFSYGQLIWKAIGSLFTRIVTAPFRALASLFGGGSERLEVVEFDPGADRILPPERQKLRTVAEALTKRPQLKLTVKPTYAEKIDRAALQSAAIRREITTRSGIKLQPGEEPGPVDFANARTQQAIEALYLERNPAAAARELRSRLQKAAAPVAEGTKPPAKPVPVATAEIARAMTQQLLDAHPISDGELTDLAKRRGDAITHALQEAGKLDSTRLATSSPSSVDSSSEKLVPTALDLSVVK